MLGGAMITTIETLWKLGHNKSEISRLVDKDWKTVSKTIESLKSGKPLPTKKPHPKILDDFKEIVIEYIEQKLSSVRIHEELSLKGLKVSYSTVKSFVSEIKGNKEVFLRIHTKPALEAQVDFGYVGLTFDNTGKKRKTWVFNMRLSYSRLDYYQKVYDQKVETFIQCHINAFKYFGGVPECIKIDNLKAAILEANFYEPVYQSLYKSFADYYNFKALPCRIYSPNDKGKVESGIKYVKQNFFLGRKFKDGNDLDKKLRTWLDNRCNQRIHGTTKKIPFELFNREEKEKLQSLPLIEFETPDVSIRKVYHDCHIYVNHNYYSVPFEYVGKEVEIELKDNILKVNYKNTNIAIHKVIDGKGKFSTNDSHYPKYKMYSQTEYQEKYQLKMSEIGPFAQQVFFIIVSNSPNTWQRPIQGILSLGKSYPKEVIELSCKRAIAFDACKYQTIKNICINGSYNLPIEFNF